MKRGAGAETRGGTADTSPLATLGLALTLVLSAACAPPGRGPAEVKGKEDEKAAVAAFQVIEDEVLRDLAAIDRRVAARALIEPREEDLRRVTMGAVLAEDRSLAVVDGVIDPFSFEARSRGLAAARAKVASAPTRLSPRAQGMMAAPSLERELLARLVDEEIVRLEEERALPRSASALVRAVVETWSVPTSAEQAATRDRWLARRLGELAASVSESSGAGATSTALDVARARELDDALDALEHALESSALARATGELVKLRDVLEQQGARPAARGSSEWSSVGPGVRAHLGFALEAEVLERRLAALQATLRAASEGALSAAKGEAEEVFARASAILLEATPCAVAVPGSRVRSMAPPPERAAVCRLRRSALAAADDVSRAAVIVAMHDHVIVARWALEVARGTATLAQASARHRPLSHPGTEVVARWERLARARPTAAIGAGLGAGVLYGEGHFEERARAWARLGEVPLDIAERELQLRPVDDATP